MINSAPEVPGEFLGELTIKAFAHRRDGANVADKILHENLAVGRRGMCQTFNAWMTTNSHSLSKALLRDDTIDRLTILCTDATGNILVGIRRMVPEALQEDFGF